jgi:hypothetical protein
MRRPQFSLKTLLWLMAVVAAFVAGIAWQRTSDNRQQMNADHERDLLEWRVQVLEENNEVLNHELRSTMLDLMRAEAKAQVNAERAAE